MDRSNELLKIALAVKPGPRNWSKLTTADLASIYLRTWKQPKKEQTLTRNLTVTYFDRARFVHFCCSLYSEDHHRDWTKVKAYMEPGFTLAKHLDNFWLYRPQLEHLDGFRGDDNKNVRLLVVDFIVPRWLVTSWDFEGEKLADGLMSWTKATPRTWKYHQMYNQ